MNKQEVFNEVADHLARQKRASTAHMAMPAGYSSACLYRTPEGLACAVGALIPNEEYSPTFERCTATTILRTASKHPETYPTLAQYVPFTTMLHDLQEVHDTTTSADIAAWWKAGLIEVAMKHSLEFDADTWLANFNNPNYVVEKNFDVGSK